MSEIRYLSIADVLALHQAIMEKHNSIAVTNSSCCAILANILKQLHASVSNLELADLIAHPSFRGALARRDHRPLPDTFGGKIEEILESSKYVRSYGGQIDGYGKIWLP